MDQKKKIVKHLIKENYLSLNQLVDAYHKYSNDPEMEVLIANKIFKTIEEESKTLFIKRELRLGLAKRSLSYNATMINDIINYFYKYNLKEALDCYYDFLITCLFNQGLNNDLLMKMAIEADNNYFNQAKIEDRSYVIS